MRFVFVAMVAVFGLSLEALPAHASLTPVFSTDDAGPAVRQMELAQKRPGLPERKSPIRGSSAELYGGSSADRYGGSSADRHGVAGRYDTRNRGVRQFDARHRKREEPRKKESDELDDQDEEPRATDRLQSIQQNPLTDRRGRD